MQDKIKVLFLAPHLSTGGMPSFLLKRIENIINFEEIEVFVVEWSNFSDEYVVQKNKIRSLVKPENFFTMIHGQKEKLIDIIKDNKIDIIHADEMLEGFESWNKIPDTLLHQIYANDRTWKIVETCHNIWFEPKTMKKYHPDGYAFCTPYHLENTFKDEVALKEVIQFPIENKEPLEFEKVQARIELNMDPRKKHIINVGLWTPGKNQGEGINIARKLAESHPFIEFHFIGNQAPNFEDYWGPIMKDIPSNVRIWGERHDVSTFMKAADVLMFNSTWECNPLVLKEGISHGLKILSRNLPQYMDMFTQFISPIDDNIETTIQTLLNCLLEERKYKSVIDGSSSFGSKYLEFYKKVLDHPTTQQKKFETTYNIVQNFMGSPYLEIQGDNNNSYDIKFFDETGKEHYSNTIKCNHWVRLNREFYTKWRTKIWENGCLIFDKTESLENKKVLISFESRSLGDTLAWFPYVEEFRKKHNCKVVASTFHNYLLKDNYQEIEFVEPGSVVIDLHSHFRLGWFYEPDNKIMLKRHPHEVKNQPMQKTASDILGLRYTEIKPKLSIPKVEKLKKVGIAIHSTAQAKYWNNPTGWQDVVDYLITLGYEVVLYSREESGYMGNPTPEGVKKFPSGNVQELIDDLATCQFFIGLGSGLSWLSWAMNIPTVIISGFSEKWTEPSSGVYRVINENVCHGCFNHSRLDSSDWMWCPLNKGTSRQFECTTTITAKMVIDEINKIISNG